jgi:hypothetical protein
LLEKGAVVKLELIAANLTRWEGRYKAMSRFIELKDAWIAMHSKKAFDALTTKTPSSFPGDFLSLSFFRRLEDYKPLLSHLNAISKAGQSQTVPTLASVPHWIWAMHAFLSPSEDDTDATAALRADLLESCYKRMDVFVGIVLDPNPDGCDFVPNAVKAALLDTRYSREVVEHLSEGGLKAVKEAIISDTLALFRDETLHDAIRKGMEGSFGGLLQKLQNACDEPDCLKWWAGLKKENEKHGSVFSNFFWSARLFLSMPAGGAPSECVFSSTTDMVTKKRNSLGDATLEQMTSIRNFVRSRTYKFDNVADRMVRRAKEIAAARQRQQEEQEDEELEWND